MINLATTYMGIQLKNPLIVGACNLSTDINHLKKLEAAGAAAIVYKSLFEEQIHLENLEMETQMEGFNERNAEMLSLFPDLEHAGPREFLFNLEKAVKAVSIPVFASLNAVYDETWADWAPQIAKTGVAGLELNFYAIPQDFSASTRDIIDGQMAILEKVKKSVNIPVAVKLSPYYTNPLGAIKRMDEAGADAFVLFNRFFQPDIDIEREQHAFPYNLSNEDDNRLPLRFAGLLHGNVKASICSSMGIFHGKDVIKMILAGADSVQVVSTLYKNGLNHLTTMLKDMEDWMQAKGYNSLDDFRGKLSRKALRDPFTYKRAQYVDILMKSNKIFDQYPV